MYRSRIAVADRLVGEEAQRLMRAHRPAHFLVDIGLDHLRAPVAVVAADEADDGDVVQQAGEHDLLLWPALSACVALCSRCAVEAKRWRK